ncbi:MAG: 16S rRNA (cytidine(1402)-2'-O)-methyltransferase [Clostridia bacterium]|nr:16S rRNA (cytidine(1402)-2'-O)-methyltransferase [Clostridia bacterium]
MTDNAVKTDGKLLLCATPIGNLGDVTERVAAALKDADAVFCEDTRNSGVLLNKLGVRNRLFSMHEHNEEREAEHIASLVAEGKTVAYVSDAGMPCISDPGARLVRVFIEKGLPFTVLPGASASLTAAILSGLGTDRIYFAGFLPRENRERTELLSEIRRVRATVVIYESPYRAAETLRELKEIMGDRDAALVREITKLFEETKRGKLSELYEIYRENAPKGECVIVVSGAQGNEKPEESLDEMLLRLMRGGMSAKDASKQAALVLDIPKADAYSRANELKNEL